MLKRRCTVCTAQGPETFYVQAKQDIEVDNTYIVHKGDYICKECFLQLAILQKLDWIYMAIPE